MIESAAIDAPPNQIIERAYWYDSAQHTTVTSVTRADGTKVPFETPEPAKARWHGDSGTYVIESNVEGAIIPAWSIPRAAELSHDESHMLRDPRDRFREVLPLWRDAAKNPRGRYLLDFEYEMPPPSEQGSDISFELNWPPGWSPVHAIKPDTIVQKFPLDTYNSVRWRAMHLFDVAAGTPADLRMHGTRMLAVAGVPIVSLLLWLLFVAREALRRGLRGGELLDENALRETIYNEPPEIIATRWSGTPQAPRIETFLRRLEKQHKLGITIEENKVSLRLLVSRDQLSPYERSAIDALIPEGFETTSDEIRKRGDFDPSDALVSYLAKFAKEINGPAKSPWWSRLTSFVIFAYGLYLLVWDVARHHDEPILFFAALVASSMLTSIWPDNFTRMMVRNTLWAVLIPLVPIALVSALVLAVNLAGQTPPSLEASVGFALVMLAVTKASLAASGTRDSRTALQRRRELVRARRWFQQELRSEHPRIRDDQIPWLEALGLRMRGARRVEEEEDWGDALVA